MRSEKYGEGAGNGTSQEILELERKVVEVLK
jgi:hypothetical protein